MKRTRYLRMLRPVQVALVVAAMLVGAGLPASAATTLAGETLTGGNDETGTNGTCNSSGPSTFTFSTRGVATGPAAGQFTESGSFTLASPTGPITSFSANFTITSAGQPDITGTKTLGTAMTASCTEESGFALVAFTATTNYTVGAPFSENGTSPQTLDATFGTTTFIEGPFAPRAAGPVTKQDCMNGGFANFIDPATGMPFKNQGQCIKFVNH